jgi:uroporphyrin-III C-methyltransferase / precorrin-2 dehydrogenase / sirohydrochlorin ferrochelatase
MAPPLLFPIFLKLEGRKVLLVGGGNVAAAKLATLQGTGALVTVVAPEVRPEVEAAAAHVERRAFAAADLDGAWLAIAAAPPEVNRAVAAAAEQRCLFVNAVDDPAPASCFAAGVVRRAGVTFAISTAGTAPALAGLLREGLEELIPDDLAQWVSEAHALRTAQKAAGVPMQERRPLLLRALNKLYGIHD